MLIELSSRFFCDVRRRRCCFFKKLRELIDIVTYLFVVVVSVGEKEEDGSCGAEI